MIRIDRMTIEGNIKLMLWVYAVAAAFTVYKLAVIFRMMGDFFFLSDLIDAVFYLLCGGLGFGPCLILGVIKGGLSFGSLVFCVFFTIRFMIPFMKFRRIFGFWPHDRNEDTFSIVEEELKNRASLFLRACQEESRIQRMQVLDLRRVSRRKVAHLKKRFWFAHGLADRCFIPVKGSVKEYV